MKRCVTVGLAAFMVSTLASVAAGTWVPLAQSPPGPAGHLLLLSDGTVIAEDLTSGYGPGWFRLTPDIHGSYVNGTWSTIASMHDTRLDFESDVLVDGRVFVAGGEYGSGIAKSEVYDLVANVWTQIPVPTNLLNPAQLSGQFNNEQQGFADCSSIVLLTGEVLIAPTDASTPGETMLFNPDSNSWTAGPATLYRQYSYQSEASWVKLADGSILTVDGYSTTSERCLPPYTNWVDDATVPVSLYDSFGDEEGPALLLPNGNAIFFGSPGCTAIYTPSGTASPGHWVAGPVFPNGQGMPDAPAAMMVNGRILCAVSGAPTGANAIYNSPTSFYEYDYTSNIFTRVNGPTGSNTFNGPSWPTLMLDLPDGSVLFGHRSTDLYIYQPDGLPLAAGKPAITSISVNPDMTLHLTGTLFDGISQGAAYGDDEQQDTDFPIVRFIDGSGNVRYGRSYNWDNTGVMTANTLVTTECTIPAGASLTDGVQVVVNGFASDIAYPSAPRPEILVLTGTNMIADGQAGAVDFGAVLQSQTGPAIQFTISNAGTATLIVSNITVPAGFALISSVPPSVAPGGSAGFTVRLNSAALGTNAGNVVILSNDPTNYSFAFPITGLVNPKSVVLTGNLSFGPVEIGSVAQGLITISNQGYTTLTVSNISYPSDAFSGAFSGTIAAGRSQTVAVSFSPDAAANYSGNIVVTSSATSGDTILAVTAFGVNADLVLTVLTSGNGRVTGAPTPADKVLTVNTKITLKAVPGNDSVFAGWTGTYNTNKNPLTFAMTTGAILQANFIPNPFPSFAGTYNGLFTSSDGVVADGHAGMLKHLAVTPKGVFTGALLINGLSKSLTGTFGLNLQASNSIDLGAALGHVNVVLSLVSNDPAPLVTGIVSGASWLSTNLTALRATNIQPAGEYTMAIEHDTGTDASPLGAGYALITNSGSTSKRPASAVANITGVLADGTAFSQAVPVSTEGTIPVYASLYNGKGLLMGWINLTDPAGDSLAWVHATVKTSFFSNAFTCTNPISLSPWPNAPANTALPGHLAVVDTAHKTPVATNDIPLSFAGSTLSFRGVNGSISVVGSIAPKTGLVKATITTGKTRTTGAGIILFNSIGGSGYYLTKTNAGPITLEP